MSNPSHSFRTPFASRRHSQSSSQSDTTSVTVSFRTVYAHSRKLSSLTVLDEVEGAEANSTGGMNHEGGGEDEEAPQSESAGNEEDGDAFCRASSADLCRADGSSDFKDEERSERKEASMSIDDANCTGDDNNVQHIMSGRRHSWQPVSHRERQVRLPYFTKDDLELWQT